MGLIDTVADELERLEQEPAAAALRDAERTSATSGEILDRLGCVLEEHRRLRRLLSEPGKQAWDDLQAQVDRAYPGTGIGRRLARLWRRLLG